MFKSLFPTKWYGAWRLVNFDRLARDKQVDESNALILSKCINHDEYAYNYGGWLEDRSWLMRDRYQAATGAFIHLGVDFVVYEWTPVACPFDGQVIHSFDDRDQDGGWGGRVMVRRLDHSALHGLVYVFGHLDGDHLPALGSVRKGQVLGLLASSKRNGGWRPHLHLQCVSDAVLERFKDWRSIDGYSVLYDGIGSDYPDPLVGFDE